MDYISAMETKIQARIDKDLKAEGEAILKQLGMNSTDLVRLTFRQLVMRKGLPFDVAIPNATTEAALKEDLSKATRHKSVKDLMDDLND